VQTAARWLRAQATALGAGSVAAIGGIGSSAGGHLVVLAALRRPGSFDFVVADAPITDTSAYAERHPYWPTRAAALDGSPIDVVARQPGPDLPPMLIAHGTRDAAVPVEASRAFAAGYRAAGGRIELLEFEGLDHAFILTHPRERASRALAQAVLRFIESQSRL
jgi:acetyl esterase/lipase